MKKSTIAMAILCSFSISTMAVELYQQDIPASTNKQTGVQVPAQKIQVAPQPVSAQTVSAALNTRKEKTFVEGITQSTRKIILNQEALILRGDIRVGYEMPTKKDWSALFEIHANPHEALNDKTGRYGLLGGGRVYVDNQEALKGIFVQFLGGANYQTDAQWTLELQLGTGYAIEWKRNILFDLGVYANRSYAEENENPFFTAMLNVGIKLDSVPKPFL